MPPTSSSRYELLDKIAKGGMAEVYRARKLGTRGYDALVAVKRILPERAEETSFVEMLIDEARITAQLKHPNIAQLYELACDETGYFLVMELLLGPNFAALIDKLKVQGRHLPQACAIEVLIQLLKALDYAHNKRDASGRPLNLVHRDISPDNLLLGPNGEVKLIDFGVAKAKDRLADKTKAGMIKGKFSYLAPERLRTNVCDGRSDLFSAALVLWESLAGRIRFDAEDDRDLIEQIETNQTPTFREMGIEIAPQLEAILNRALKTRPDERYQSAADFLDVLESYQQRFNPGDNTARLGKLVASSFKEELRWLEDALLKFQEGRLRPLGVIGGGIVEERFQLSKRSISAQRATDYQLRVPSARRSSPSPFADDDRPQRSGQRRIETNIFANRGIELLDEDDFEEVSAQDERCPLGPASGAPKTEIAPPPTMLRDDRRADSAALPLGTPKSDQRTKTRVFDFGHGVKWSLTFDPRKVGIVAGAILGGILLFALFRSFAGDLPLPPEPPRLDASPAATTTAAGVPARPKPPPPSAAAALPLPQPLVPPPAPQPLVAPPTPIAPAVVPTAPTSAAATATTAAAAAPAEVAPPAKKKPAKKPNKRRKARGASKKRQAVQRKAPARVADEADSFDEDLDADDDFFESDDDGDEDAADEADEASAPRKAQSAQSAADEAFDDF